MHYNKKKIKMIKIVSCFSKCWFLHVMFFSMCSIHTEGDLAKNDVILQLFEASKTNCDLNITKVTQW